MLWRYIDNFNFIIFSLNLPRFLFLNKQQTKIKDGHENDPFYEALENHKLICVAKDNTVKSFFFAPKFKKSSTSDKVTF